MMDIHKILKQLPHRYPFLLVDRVLEIEKGVRIKALKNVTINEPFFTGHFPHRPVMPGVLMLEALAQAAGLLAGAADDDIDQPADQQQRQQPDQHRQQRGGRGCGGGGDLDVVSGQVTGEAVTA